jgi:hypothetical protein
MLTNCPRDWEKPLKQYEIHTVEFFVEAQQGGKR